MRSIWSFMWISGEIFSLVSFSSMFGCMCCEHNVCTNTGIFVSPLQVLLIHFGSHFLLGTSFSRSFGRFLVTWWWFLRHISNIWRCWWRRAWRLMVVGATATRGKVKIISGTIHRWVWWWTLGDRIGVWWHVVVVEVMTRLVVGIWPWTWSTCAHSRVSSRCWGIIISRWWMCWILNRRVMMVVVVLVGMSHIVQCLIDTTSRSWCGHVILWTQFITATHQLISIVLQPHGGLLQLGD